MLNGERRSSNRAYLSPAVRKRPNLTVQTRAFVRRVIVSGGRAVGVEFDGPAGRKTVTAKKEVIVSAGAYNSPQVLMLSGIGPKKHLQEVGIKPVLDLPGVGQRLHDHSFASGQVKFLLSKTASAGTVQQYIDVVKEYVQKRTGPLSATANPVSLWCMPGSGRCNCSHACAQRARRAQECQCIAVMKHLCAGEPLLPVLVPGQER